MKGMTSVQTVIILIIAVVVLAVILSFVVSTSQPAQTEIQLKGEFNLKCADLDCKDLLTDPRAKELCKTLFNQPNQDLCLKTYCSRCANFVLPVAAATGRVTDQIANLQEPVCGALV